LIVQLLPAVTLVQLFVCENWFTSVPVRFTPLIVSTVLPVLLTVTACAVLVVFTVWLKLKLVGFTEITDAVDAAITPAPLKATLVGLPLALCVIEIEAVLLPTLVGVNVTLMAQLAPTATVLQSLD
jgi:hypothetical protein